MYIEVCGSEGFNYKYREDIYRKNGFYVIFLHLYKEPEKWKTYRALKWTIKTRNSLLSLYIISISNPNVNCSTLMVIEERWRKLFWLSISTAASKHFHLELRHSTGESTIYVCQVRDTTRTRYLSKRKWYRIRTNLLMSKRSWEENLNHYEKRLLQRKKGIGREISPLLALLWIKTRVGELKYLVLEWVTHLHRKGMGFHARNVEILWKRRNCQVYFRKRHQDS